ncbi:F-box domain-containing protein [Favolaschia claudopus]|uniref:F-box domain-containing protein n=1 Tax=Favolaschia claudopus TaxID=2862362 RepID=A0AAW0B892_9AGAR
MWPNSVPELREVISEISSAIDAQQAILHDLLTKRSKALRKLNFFLDPMTRLPLEIQSNILLFVGSNSYPPQPTPKSPPMIFLSVCRLWRDIALATPQLWVKIQMDSLPRRPNYAKLCDMWLKRARSFPLSISLHGSLQIDHSVQNLLARYSAQLSDLTLSISANAPPDRQFPYVVWRRGAKSLPSLKTLSIEATAEDPYCGDMREWLGIMRDAPNLSSCVMFDMVYEEEDDDDAALDILTLPSLETLELGDAQCMLLCGEHGSSAAILRHLTLPALKALTLSSLDEISIEEMTAFLHRSCMPLESFNTVFPPQLLPMIHYLRLIPSLVTLQLHALPSHGPNGDPFHLVLHELRTTSDFLPNLRTLEIHTVSPVRVDYDTVLTMLRFRLTSCPTPLERFEISFPQYMNSDHAGDLPNEEVRAGLRQLVEDGLKIHIGHSENLL